MCSSDLEPRALAQLPGDAEANPLVGIVEGFRSSFLSLPFDWKALGIVTVVTFLMLGYVAHAYYRWEDGLIDTL